MGKTTPVLIVAVLVAIGLFLLLPVSYRLDIKNTSYYERCEPEVQGSCRNIAPPVSVVERGPFIAAWWEKIQVHRAFSDQVVEADWTEPGRGGILRNLLLSLLPLVVAGAYVRKERTPDDTDTPPAD